ncbi:hypothetical protein FSP39_022607 [Pinctada imbricata]|uniref:Uncharacterized protein n=1 Tax=Pinctada imbricata TaxID=66713 RepID=A0AA88Y5V5_PINIB|nr:hypothetical protein FSP39_022607 [Pinctada imbricata]
MFFFVEFEEQEFIKVADKELEKSLQSDVLKFQSFNQDKKKKNVDQKDKDLSRGTTSQIKDTTKYDSIGHTDSTERGSVSGHPRQRHLTATLSEIRQRNSGSNSKNAISTEKTFHSYDKSIQEEGQTTTKSTHATLKQGKSITHDSDVPLHDSVSTIVNSSVTSISGDRVKTDKKRTTTLLDLDNVYYERQLQFLSRLYKGGNSQNGKNYHYETQISRPDFSSVDVGDEKKTFLSRLRHKFLSLSKIKRKLKRTRRQIPIDANEGWAIKYTTFSPKEKSTKSRDSFQIVSDEDRKKAEQEKIKKVLVYTAWTLASVFIFSFIAYCFVKNPKTCIVSFATGCPCCVLCAPLFNRLYEKYNPKQLMKDNLNKYLPGVIIHEDGTQENYEPTPEEMEIVGDIFDELEDLAM